MGPFQLLGERAKKLVEKDKIGTKMSQQKHIEINVRVAS